MKMHVSQRSLPGRVDGKDGVAAGIECGGNVTGRRYRHQTRVAAGSQRANAWQDVVIPVDDHQSPKSRGRGHALRRQNSMLQPAGRILLAAVTTGDETQAGAQSDYENQDASLQTACSERHEKERFNCEIVDYNRPGTCTLAMRVGSGIMGHARIDFRPVFSKN